MWELVQAIDTYRDIANPEVTINLDVVDYAQGQ